MSGGQNNYPLGDYVQPLKCKPGVDRDSTILACESFLDSQHMRFDDGQPRKIGGYEKIFNGNGDIIRFMYPVAIDNFIRFFLFRDTGVAQIDLFPNGTVSGEIDRTPSGWVPPLSGTPSLTFSVDQMTIVATSTQTVENYIIFVAPPNSENPNQTQEAPIFIGSVYSTLPFAPLNQTCSGGILVSDPFLIKYGNDGLMYYSEVRDPFVFPTKNVVGVTAQKLLLAKRYQGGILFWSATQLERAVFNTQTSEWSIVPAAPKISLLSPSSIVESHNSSFMWVGIDNMYLYNGVTNTITNVYNRNQFFDSLNTNYRGKVWGIYMGRFEEIWFFNVEGAATETNRAYIYKYKDGEWCDTYLDRSCGVEAGLFIRPLMAENKTNPYSNSSQYSVWQHEKGFNIVYNGTAYPLEAWIQTKLFSVFLGNPQVNVEMRIQKIERDIAQAASEVQVNILTYKYPYSDPWTSPTMTLKSGDTELNPNISGRYISFKFTSNTLDGFMQVGDNMYQYQLGNPNP